MADASLTDKHLAELHELAAERGIERFRMLSRDELIAELGGAQEAREPAAGGDRGRARGRRESGGRRGGRREREPDRDEAEEPAAEPVSGVLEITSRGHGFLRLDDPDAEGDIYVSPSQIRRCELQEGDAITGPAREPRRGERHPALVHIDTVNGAEPGGERSKFEELVAIPPHRRLAITGAGAEPEIAVLLRAVDLLAPLARGQRVLVKAARGSGRTTLLRALARELSAVEDLETIVVLVDERPEEEPVWREALPDTELRIAGAEMRPGEQLRAVEMAVSQAKRKAERGADVALLIDSLSRLAVAADDPGAAKPIFGAGRETEGDESGSLTVIATALTDDDDDVDRALATTENVTIELSRELAEAGVYPALDAAACRVVAEDSLREGAELAGARALRAELAAMPARDAAERLAERIRETETNEALLSALGE